MATINFGDSPLIRQFRDLYSEVINLKKFARTGVIIGDDDVVPDMPDGTAWRVKRIGERLNGIVDRYEQAAVSYGGEYLIIYEEARYVMVALADEIFLNLDWDGRFIWNFNLLESRLFNSHIAGERFFQRLDRLLSLTSDAIHVELAKVYLMALCLGFQGRYRGADPNGDLISYRTRLYNYIAKDVRYLERDEPLFPEAHRHTFAGLDKKLLPPIRIWMIRLGVAFLFVLALQHVIWEYVLVPDLRRQSDSIIGRRDTTWRDTVHAEIPRKRLNDTAHLPAERK